jgi:hypothetical protein
MIFFKYKFYKFTGQKLKEYKINTIKISDIEKIRIWRNKQINLLRQKGNISKIDQKIYFLSDVKKELNKKKPNLILFAFRKNNKLIGYGGYTNINWSKKYAELSFLLDNNIAKKNSHYKKKFEIFLLLARKFAKKILLKQLISFTFISRKNHIEIMENFGFIKKKIVMDKSKKSYCFKHILKIYNDK